MTGRRWSTEEFEILHTMNADGASECAIAKRLGRSVSAVTNHRGLAGLARPPKARLAAKRSGDTRYFTGEPCPRGHVAERFVSNGSCSVCERTMSDQRRLANPEKERAVGKVWRDKNLDRLRAQGRARRVKNIDKVRASLERWRLANPDYEKNRRQSNIQFRLAGALRCRLKMALRNKAKGGSAVRDLGCTSVELIERLESKFLPGMSWENYGFGADKWHIDHRRPLSSFDLTLREHVLQACHWTNLQPLWAIDNLRKGSRW